jgi:hypothetical protein
MKCFPLLSVFLAVAATAHGQLIELTNPGFEEDLSGWRTKEDPPMSSVTNEAAYEGEAGLRVDDQDPANGSNVISSLFPVSPGRSYQLRYWARTSVPPPAAGVFIWTYDASKKFLDPKDAPAAMIRDADGNWHEYSLDFTVPEGVGYAALWIHSLSGAQGVFDFDAIEIEDLGDAN